MKIRYYILQASLLCSFSLLHTTSVLIKNATNQDLVIGSALYGNTLEKNLVRNFSIDPMARNITIEDSNRTIKGTSIPVIDGSFYKITSDGTKLTSTRI